MRSFLLLVLTAGLAVGCTSSRYDRYERGRAYPASARVDHQGGQDRYRICHKGKDTKVLPASAVRGHLRHGDEFGPCRRDRRDDRGRRGRGRGRGRN